MISATAASATTGVQRRHVEVRGVVQGVGFRPFVHRLATELGLFGHVGNDAEKVFIEVEGQPACVETFLGRLLTDAPPLAKIESIIHSLNESVPGADRETRFEIVASVDRPGAVTLVSPDVATCADCLAEMADSNDRRFGHPFITCTNCGPRFTIIRALPYDRPNTTMAAFEMCRQCADEYADPSDRRYHAQPIACHECGPSLSFVSGSTSIADHGGAIASARSSLMAGRIVAIKGLGGYHLACDARSSGAVAILRQRKGRADKPFAVMVADLETARTLAVIDEGEAEQLTSPARPIVLLRSRPSSEISALVAPGNPLIGVMLAYTPVHHLLLAGLGALVMTSGNRAGEPIAFRDADALRRLGDLTDDFLIHDRPINSPCDDSVIRVVDGDILPIRRSRGFAPLPVVISAGGPDLLAVGAELKNTFCVTSGGHAWVSQHIGDMENLETVEAFDAAVDQYCNLYRIQPTVVVADAHPGYLTAKWARKRFGPLVTEVQHHHAHVASVLAEHRRDPFADVIGMAFDGTGYGSDGTIWGGECLVANALQFDRVAHLRNVALPGGDAAIKNPCRVAVAHLWAAGLEWSPSLASVAALSIVEQNLLRRQFETGVGCVPTSSMGRLFDAISSLLGLRQSISYEAQAAIDLEIAAARHLDDCPTYRFGLDTCDGPWQVDPAPVVAAVVADMLAGRPVGPSAAAFHHAVASLVIDIARRIGAGRGLGVVALSGGVFQNVTLVRLTKAGLERAGFDVLTHRVVPPNDGGLALGQAFIGSARSSSINATGSAAGPGKAG